MKQNLSLLLFPLTRLLLRGRQLLRTGQVVDGNGQEDVQQCVVAEQYQNDEVHRVDHAALVDAALRLDRLVHHLVPVLAGENLKDGQQGNGKGVEVGRRRLVLEVEGAAEELHAEQGKDEDEEKEQKEQ